MIILPQIVMIYLRQEILGCCRLVCVEKKPVLLRQTSPNSPFSFTHSHSLLALVFPQPCVLPLINEYDLPEFGQSYSQT